MYRKWTALLLVVGWIIGLLCGCDAPAITPTVSSSQSTSVTSQSTQSTSQPASQPTQATSQPASLPTRPTTAPSAPPADPIVICIDAGHQQSAIWDTEPNGPGSDVMKAKLSSGTQGVATKIPEYQLNLDVSLLLEAELISRGYQVVMIRCTNDCPLSNAERAQVANESGADIFIRIHANGADTASVKGMLCCAPTSNNPFLTQQVIDESIRLSDIITKTFCAATGANNQGIYYVDTMTGINWCQIPVTIVEIGYMSNPDEDRAMASPDYRQKMVTGIANGIDAYFADT